MSLDRSFVLIGMMGSGKSTMANVLAREFDVESVSLDRAITKLANRKIAEIFESDGEERFRELESKVLADSLNESPAVVIDCGGGVVEREQNRRLLIASDSNRCYLSASADVLIERTGNDASRPMLRGAEFEQRIGALLAKRDSLYREVATHIVEVSPEDGIADTKQKILEQLS